MKEQLVTDVVLAGHKVYALDEVTDELAAAADAIVSIVDPETTGAVQVSLSKERYLVLRFFDYDHDDLQSPQLDHVHELIAFAAKPGEKLLVRCYAGISRSTASLTIVLAYVTPELDYDAIFEAVYRIRPQAWPNARLIACVDKILKCEGQFSAALARFRASLTESDE